MAEQKKVDLSKLEPEQIASFRKQFEDELEHFSSSLASLNLASNKFKECVVNIQQVGAEESEGKDILVPLSSSLYVPGKVKDNKKFLVDVGTGYYVEKNAKDATAFYEAKIKKLMEDYQQLTKIINEKQLTIQRIDQILRQKVQQRENQSQQPAQ
ncbi:Prefoldin subunit 5 [Wickerhamomyces ciferrii]|uniref:Prefoldin subunit 5 n=1 Tax=Wickerhamomyces ciferrii (strain ATCC 14091 / BCRC 22168 / CBS 111 / JCM 3599 / NBRC 0793 / NRRL Y-1031 F-60-10) TaxID=1206466 RepID=K0KTM9_WICCF|nr:Prefoldin subunit 5 [Wickerhamomyces ciferrii]CCH45377.1 Prefoldin subunit 5 [Wickerhamomyces ciferrii]